MTPEETKEYIDHRLQDLGLQLKLDGAGYEKIFSFTNGTESGANKICYKLLSLCSDDDTRAISGETLATAIDELVHVEDLLKRSAKPTGRKHNEEVDRASIEKLAAVLEANADTADMEPQSVSAPPVRPRAVARSAPAAKPGGNGAHRPKVLIINDSQTRRSMVANVLAKNFTCVEAADAERAWKILAEQRDIDIVVTDLQGHNRNGYDLIAGIRSAAAPSYLVGIPIIAIAATDDAAAQQRARAAGANDVIPLNTDAGELESRVYARYKSSRAQQRAPSAPAARNKPPVARPDPGAAAREPQPLGPPFGKPRTSTARTIDPARFQAMTRPFMPRSGIASASLPDSFIRRLHRISTTTTITLSATVLVIVALTIILYANRIDYDGAAAQGVQPVPRVAQSDPAPRLPPPLEPEVKQEPPPTSANAPGASDAGNSVAPPPITSPARPAPEKQQNNAAAAPGTDANSKERDTAPLARDESIAKNENKPPVREPPRIASAPPAEGGEARSPMEDRIPDRPAPTAQQPATTSAAPSAPDVIPEPTPAPETPKPLLSPDELGGLLKRFVFVYEAGDIDQFMNLFAPSARTNDRANRNGIREDYENLFRATDLRLMKLSHVNWEVENTRAQGWGNFEVAVRRAGEQQVHDYQGSITLYVEKVDGRPRIVRLYHGQRRAEK